jgi:hypothetical protein
MSAMAFIVKPVKPRVVFITGAVSAIHFLLLQIVGLLDRRGSRRSHPGSAALISTTISRTAAITKREFCIVEIKDFYAHYNCLSVVCSMKLAGFLLLLAGWGIVLAAVALLRSGPQQSGFVLAGTGVELLGLALAVRSHMIPRPRRG